MTVEAFRMLLRVGGPFRRRIPLLVVLGLLASLAEGLGVGLLIPVVGAMLQADAGEAAGPFARFMQSIGAYVPDQNRLILLGLMIAFLVVVKTLVLVINARLGAWINGHVTSSLRVELLQRLLRMNFASFRALERGRLMNIMDVQAGKVSEAILHAISLVTAACFVAVYGILLLLISWELTIVVVAGAIPVSMFVRNRTRRAQTLAEDLIAGSAALTGRVIEVISAMRTIRIFAKETAEVQKFTRMSEEVRTALIRAETVNATIKPIIEFLYAPLFLGIITYAWLGGIGVPSLLAFLILLYRLQPQLSRIDWARVSLAGLAPGIRELESILHRTSDTELAPGHHPLVRVSESIEFDRVSFRYPEKTAYAVQDVSFTIHAGSVCAIVGRSGAGKSTLLNLLFGLYDPTSGVVRIDGVPIGDFDLTALRSAMAFAGQDTELMTGTIGQNIAFGRPSASFDEIVQAARAAHADEFIRRLPNGYDTVVESQGSNFSGGQRQRISLARALIRRPSVLILDEATNAVDNLAESSIQETIEELARQCTIVIVAHRLSTVRLADYLVVLSDGKVIEAGAPGDVRDLCGEFAKLYELS